MDIINTAAFAWQVVTDNKPTSSVSGSFATGIPAGANWQDLSPAAGTNVFRWTFKNGWILPDFSYDLSLHWSYGARWRKGGAFITNCWMEVDDYSIGMGGINVNISCSVGHPEQGGSETAPITVLPVTVQMSYSTWLWGGGGKATATLWGNGMGTFFDTFDDETHYQLPATGNPDLQPAAK